MRRKIALVGLLGTALATGVSAADGVLLDRSPDRLVSLELPDSSRAELPDAVPVLGPWRVVRTVAGVRTWEARLPVRLRALFFNNPPEDMRLHKRAAGGDEDHALTHANGLFQERKADTWEFSAHAIRVRRHADDGPPDAGEYSVRYGRAIERERSLNLSLSERDDKAFVFRSAQIEDTSRHGLLLPAPASATFEVEVPADGVLDLDAGLLPPEAAPAVGSDGARLKIEVGSAGSLDEVLDVALTVGHLERQRVSLARWAGRTVQIRLSTDPAGSAELDYVFVAEPVIYTPVKDPPRVILVFVDTLRRDHLSLYGYGRETTPKLDVWAEQAAVFDSARTVAPWTLPSSRTMMTGAQPERWGQVEPVQDRFAKAGWATGFLVGNVYLSSNFDMAAGWGVHRCINWPIATTQVGRALDVLDRYADRPLFLAVHFMDMHLPYKEPPWWRFTFAGRTPEALGTEWFLRSSVMRSAAKLGDAGKQYVKDRYDNNLAFLDHQLARLLGRLDPGPNGRDTVVVLSDHGEEFWDHGGFEHGHSLHDELLRVPMVVRAPGIKPGRYAEPVSLLDVTPTLLTAVGLDTSGTEGKPLQGLASGEAADEFTARDQGFGRPLYGRHAWAVLHDGQKYYTSVGKERLWDLREDPEESVNLAESASNLDAWRTRLGASMAMPSQLGWRLVPTGSRLGSPLTVELTVPGGVVRAWAGDDPLDQSVATVAVDGERVTIVFGGTKSGVREVFVVPAGDPYATVQSLGLEATSGTTTAVGRSTWKNHENPPPPGDGKTLWRARAGTAGVELTWAVEPQPAENAHATSGFDGEAEDSLKALGYLDE